MGVVYLGQTPERRLVAIKAVREDLAHDPEFRARFKHEVGAVSGVAGFCTARMLDADVDAERPWYASEFTIALVICLLLGGYAAYTSVGGTKVFAGEN